MSALIFLMFLAVPFIIFSWILRHFLQSYQKQTEEQMKQELAKTQLEARMARPLKDYVANLKPKKIPKIPFHTSTSENSSPTPNKMRPLATFSTIGDSREVPLPRPQPPREEEEYFIRDDQGNVYGPADESTLYQWIGEGRIAVDTSLGIDSKGPWLPAGQIRALANAFEESEDSSET